MSSHFVGHNKKLLVLQTIPRVYFKELTTCKIWGFHRGQYSSYFLGYDAV